jgi:predicted DNA-binding transcriptional regulator YafY
MPAATSRTSSKVQRWIDVLTALLSHTFPQTFIELARAVPGYLADGSVNEGDPSPSLKRMFERDKLELRTMGVPIETIGEEGDEESRYRLRSTDFYLPYLAVAAQRGMSKPKKVDRDGYRSLSELTFDADELVAIAEAASRARQLGDPILRADVDSAVRKLAVDLPLGAASAGDGTWIVQPRARPDAEVIERLSEALFHQKHASFDYRSMGRGETNRRTVEPYGLVFLNSHWYLVARDADRDARRNFRLSRISNVSINGARKGTPDYEIPASFSLREHAQSKNAWELGDEEPLDAVVEIRGESGAARAAAALGRSVAGHGSRKSYSVRRRDVFARWLLSFAGELVPLAPEELVAEYRRQAEATRQLYARKASR